MKNALAVAALLAASSAALADGQALMTSPGNGAYHAQATSGYIGEGGGAGFDTFCVELNEYFSPPESMGVVLSMNAVNGGVGGGSPDPLSERTALMYRTFRDGGTFATASYGNVVVTGDAFWQAKLQDAIWASEDEVTLSSLSQQARELYDWAQNNAVAGNFYNVAVMNTTRPSGERGQDFLTIVPLPTAAWAGLGSLAMVLGTGYIRRRSQQA
jgi:hypothetical protein